MTWTVSRSKISHKEFRRYCLRIWWNVRSAQFSVAVWKYDQRQFLSYFVLKRDYGIEKIFYFEFWPCPKFVLRIFEAFELPFTTIFKVLKTLLKKIKYCFDVTPCRLYEAKNASSHWHSLTLKMLVRHEGCLTVHLPHEITSKANLMQQGNFINVFLARHVSGTFAHHQEHWMLSCSVWFSAPRFWMGGGLESRCVSCSQDHRPSKNSVQNTVCCKSTSNAPDDGRMYPKHVELRIH